MYSRSLTTVAAAAAALCSPALAQQPANADAPKASKNIVQVAADAGSFETLLTAAKAAGLAETLQSKGPFTVFAPTDEAFAKLPEGTIPALLEDTDKLKAILTYHVVPGRFTAKDLMTRDFADTVQGQSLRVQIGKEKAQVDGVRVVKADVAASNGVIHVIDSVLMPRPDLVATAAEAGSFSKLLAAAKAAGLVSTLQGDGPLTVFAPTDAAFAKLPEGTLESLLRSPEKLKAILTYHVVPGRVLAKDIPMADGYDPSLRAETAQGQKLAIRRTDKGVTVGAAKVVEADILAANGIIHVIDTVLLPADSE